MLATFAAGCFLGVEEAFRALKGVKTKVGYTGGFKKQPTYEQVCTGKTGHAEAVQVEYDPKRISYEKLLEVFWKIHNPTTLNRQGFDFGTQYRSAIFYHNEQQRRLAIASKNGQQEKYNKKIVTEVIKATEFYPAEEYHQKYLMKKGKKTC